MRIFLDCLLYSLLQSHLGSQTINFDFLKKIVQILAKTLGTVVNQALE